MKPRHNPPESATGRNGLRRSGGWLIGAALVGALVALLAYLLSGTASTKREVAVTPTLVLPPPPPPPPEPEKLPEPEPEKVEPEIVETEPAPVEPLEQAPDEAPPSPQQDLGDPVTIDGAAQAGNDAFGIAAGRGGGMSGTGRGGGFGEGAYGRYVSTLMQQALASEATTRQLVFDDLQVDLWLDAEGRVTRLSLVRGSGAAETDEAVLAALRAVTRIDEQPPAAMRFPIRLSMKGRRP